MDFFYDGQIRRYVTQFMRVFIGFKYQAGDKEERLVPVMYGDLTRQVASIIKDNSENKMPTVPRISCYITGLELDTSRLSDSTFVSKVNVRERTYQDVAGQRVYGTEQGAGYTVERLMPTPFKLKVKADVWTSNTDQKLQLLEQILILFNPSLEVQTTDNYVDWTSLSVIYLTSTNFSSRSIPQGTDTDIDIASLEFEMPIYISPPTKVKKLGVVRAVINNMFTNTGDAVNINNLIYNDGDVQTAIEYKRYGIVMLKADNGVTGDYNISIVDVGQAVLDAGLDLPPEKIGKKLDWQLVLDQYGGYKEGVSRITFKQPNGSEMFGSIAVNPADPTLLVVSMNMDTVPGNTLIATGRYPDNTVYTSVRSVSKGTIDAIINPYNFNPLTTYGSKANYPVGLRYLMLDDVNTFLAPQQAASIATNVINTDIDYYRIVRPDQREIASSSNLPRSYSNIYETKVFVNGSEVAFTPIEDGGKFATYDISAGSFIVGHTYTIKTPGSTNFIAIGAINNNIGTEFVATGIGSGSGVTTGTYRTESGKYKILLASFPPLEVSPGKASVITYKIERYTYPDWFTEGDDPDTETVETDVYLPGKPERAAGVVAWQNLDGSSNYIKANSIIEWNGTQWVSVFDPEEVTTNIYITNLRTGIQYKWDGVQWLKSFEGEYLPGSWRLTLNP
jgi:hypothetical protein